MAEAELCETCGYPGVPLCPDCPNAEVYKRTPYAGPDRWIRAFNRLEAAVTHHKRATANPLGDHDTADVALYKTRDRILNDLTEVR